MFGPASDHCRLRIDLLHQHQDRLADALLRSLVHQFLSQRTDALDALGDLLGGIRDTLAATRFNPLPDLGPAVALNRSAEPAEFMLMDASMAEPEATTDGERLVDELFDRHRVDVTTMPIALSRLREAAEEAKKALSDMHSGEVLKVLATDPGSVRDFQAFARQTGNDLVEQQANEVNCKPEYVPLLRRR